MSACSTPPPAAGPGELPAATPALPPPPQAQDAAPAARSTAVDSRDAAALQAWAAMQERLMRVAAPLLLHNTELCPRDARPLIGLSASTKHGYGEALAAAAGAALQLDDELKITMLLPGAAAAASGIKIGDAIVAVNEKDVGSGAGAARRAGQMLAAQAQTGRPARLTVRRRDERYDFMVPFTRACAYAILPGDTATITSMADGRRILVTRGMLDFAAGDTELAYVIASEMAHNVLARARRTRAAARIDALGLRPAAISSERGGTVPPPAAAVADAMADKLALYMLARAKFEVREYGAFWKRVDARARDAAPDSYPKLHPALAYRLSVIAAVTQDIAYKLKRNRPLKP